MSPYAYAAAAEPADVTLRAPSAGFGPLRTLPSAGAFTSSPDPCPSRPERAAVVRIQPQ